jgi:hypothetical protein
VGGPLLATTSILAAPGDSPVVELARRVDEATWSGIVETLREIPGASRHEPAADLLPPEGIDLVIDHHQRKATTSNPRPKSLDDVYGSVFVPAGAGSVILLWGTPGAAVIEPSHLKQPAESVGPLDVLHEHDTGEMSIFDRPDLVEAAAGA